MSVEPVSIRGAALSARPTPATRVATPERPPTPAPASSLTPTTDVFERNTRPASHSGENTPLRALPGYLDATPSEREVLDRLIETYSSLIINEKDGPIALAQLLGSRVWLNGDAATRRRMLSVASVLATRNTDRALLSLGDRGVFGLPLQGLAQMAEDGRLLARSTTGTTVLEALAQIADSGLGPRAQESLGEVSTSEVLSDLVLEMEDPGRIDQARAASCTMTSLTYALLNREPGEYARIVADLLISGRAKLRSGAVIDYQPSEVERTTSGSGFASPTDTRRSASERVLQSALMAAAYPEATYTSNHAGAGERFERFDLDTSVMQTLPEAVQVLLWILFPIGLTLRAIPIHLQWIGVDERRLARVASDVFGEPFRTRKLRRQKALQEIERLAGPDGRIRDGRIIVSFDRYGEGSSVGHALNLVAIDRSSSPPALICRDPGGSVWVGSRGLIALGALPGIVYEDPQQGTVRIPMNDTMLDALSHLVLPERLR